MPNRAEQIFQPQFKFGLGGVPLGNEFNKHTDKEAEATLEAAWALGVRYYDVAPWYGFGLAERRFGHFLHNKTEPTMCCLPRWESSSRHQKTTGMPTSSPCRIPPTI